MKDVDDDHSCPDCGSTHLTRDYERAEVICEKCGLVTEDNIIDQTPEWNAYSYEEENKMSRTGSPMNYMLHDKGLSTEISAGNVDYYGKKISYKNRIAIHRMRKWQYRTRARNTAERNLLNALKKINQMASQLGLPKNVKEHAAMIYRDVAEINVMRGRNTESVIAAAIYAACRKWKVPRTLDEISDFTNLENSKARKKVGKSFRFLVHALNLSFSPPLPVDYMPRYANELDLDKDVREQTLELLKRSTKAGFTVGKNPLSVVAAAIYLAGKMCGKRKKQHEIVEAIGVTEVSIRNRYKEMEKKLNITFSSFAVRAVADREPKPVRVTKKAICTAKTICTARNPLLSFESDLEDLLEGVELSKINIQLPSKEYIPILRQNLKAIRNFELADDLDTAINIAYQLLDVFEEIVDRDFESMSDRISTFKEILKQKSPEILEHTSYNRAVLYGAKVLKYISESAFDVRLAGAKSFEKAIASTNLFKKMLKSYTSICGLQKRSTCIDGRSYSAAIIMTYSIFKNELNQEITLSGLSRLFKLSKPIYNRTYISNFVREFEGRLFKHPTFSHFYEYVPTERLQEFAGKVSLEDMRIFKDAMDEELNCQEKSIVSDPKLSKDLYILLTA
jgi:transcription initiation factor TFIIB